MGKIIYYIGDGRYLLADRYQPAKIMPYMHIMVDHAHTVIENFGNMMQFSCQCEYIIINDM